MKNLNDIKELDKKELNAIQGGKGRIAGKKGEPEDLVDLDNQETPT
ncbi:MAG: ComC/BlpC family leader-containing pheromone/bacteriocin [Prevotella sp.]|nr:ComC/BlpC family leader-containing pheromone/bacteriocin [Prevotella sp.]